MPLVNTRLDGEILLIGINRPEKRNCVNHATAIALVKAFERFNRDPAVKIGILYGEGGNFCAGYDLSEISQLENAVTDDRFPNEYRYLGPSIIPLEKPLIVAVEGYAVAGGLELSLMADIRVCSRSAKFGVFCRRHGVPLIDGGTVRLPRIVGLGRALDMTLTGRTIDATEALQWGLVTKVVDDGKALDTALQMATELLRYPYACMLSDRRSMLKSYDLTTAEAFEFELNNVAVIPEAIQRSRRFLAKKNGAKTSKL